MKWQARPPSRGMVAVGLGLAVVAVAWPLLPLPAYVHHVSVLALLWAALSTSWSLMGQFELVSLGHGAFMGLGAYVPALLLERLGLSPWLGWLAALAASAAVMVLVGYPCFRFRVIGDYFALVTLALSEVTSLAIIAARDVTGGSLGFTLAALRPSSLAGQLWFMEFESRTGYYVLAWLLLALNWWAWRRIQGSRLRLALTAVGEDEVAAASCGVSVVKSKLAISLLSALLATSAGTLYARYVGYINPATVSGVTLSLQVAFVAILGGMYAWYGPALGAAITVGLAETLRIHLGSRLAGLSEVVYGVVVILLIVFFPRGLAGWLGPAARRQGVAGAGQWATRMLAVRARRREAP